jgi:hypothetical protein
LKVSTRVSYLLEKGATLYDLRSSLLPPDQPDNSSSVVDVLRVGGA